MAFSIRNLWRRFWAIIIIVSLTFFCAYLLLAIHKPAPEWDLGAAATVLFGAASIALFLFSIFVGAVAIFGWQNLEHTIERSVNDAYTEKIQSHVITLEAELKDRIKTIYDEAREEMNLIKVEARGRVTDGLGYILGEVGMDSDSFNPRDREKLKDAIDLLKAGYRDLAVVGGAPEFLALNNLVYYSSVYGAIEDKDDLLRKARILKDKGYEKKSINLQLTACRAILQFSSDPQEIQDARATLIFISESAIAEKQRKEALLYLAAFQQKIEDGKG